MNNRRKHRHHSRNIASSANTTPLAVSTSRKSDASTWVSTKLHIRASKRSSDNFTSQQQGRPVDEPAAIVTSEISCEALKKDLTTTSTSKSYSSRNMLRNSRPVQPTVHTASVNLIDDKPNRLSWQNMDDLNCYTILNEDCFTFESDKGAICLLCGKRVIERSIREHNESEYHYSQFRKLDLNLMNENMDESSLQMSTIKALCDTWLSTYSLNEKMIRMRNNAVDQFKSILGSINPECQLRMHGSSNYGAATRESDVNLELIHPNSSLFEFDPRSKSSVHHKLIDPDAEYGNQFNEHTLNYDLVSNPVETMNKIFRFIADSSRILPSYPFIVTSELDQLHRKIPSITLEHLHSRTILNINCYSQRRYKLAQLLRAYMLMDIRLEPLSKLVKIWAKSCGIDKPDLGSYPPHAYVVMMIYYLQRTEPPVLPCLHDLLAQNTKPPDRQMSSDRESNCDPAERGPDKIGEAHDDDLEDEEEDAWTSNIEDSIMRNLNWSSDNKSPTHVLFIQFFKFMIEEFSLGSNVITIRTLERVPSKLNTQSKVIEDPLNRKINISRCITSMKTFDFIRDCFFHTYFYLTSIPIDESLKPRNIIRSDPRDYITLYVNSLRLNTYRTWKEPSIGKARYDPIDQMIQQKLFARDIEVLHALSTKSSSVAGLPQTLANLYDPGLLRPQNISYSYSCWLCRSTGHSRDKCPKGAFDTLHDELETYDLELDTNVNLDSVLMNLYKNGTISESLSYRHNQVLGMLKRIINEALDLNLNFVLYGSTVNNLGSCDSDLDICVTVNDNLTGTGVDCVAILKSIQKVLETIIEVHDIQPVFSARVPIIRFKFDDFDIDMSMYNQCAIYNSKLLKAYSLSNVKVAPLCYLVKKFAKECGIADASMGSLSSYAWSLLVIYYLQRLDPPVLPILQEPVNSTVRDTFGVNGWNVWFHDKPIRQTEDSYSLTRLLKGFYLFYGVFDFVNAVVSIRKSAQITKFQKSWVGCMIAIEDPFELTYNLANRLSDPMAIFIQNSFAQTYRHIVNIQRMIDSRTDPNISPGELISRLFDYRQITKVGPPLRGCLICHKIGHKLKECPGRKNDNRRSPKKDSNRSNPGFGKWKR